ncbi:hypothetical protein KIN20_001931 [Parelaphostrongylus tenuis]|uniref:Uncharacterized protein n=1 Tax=Parelaphostrongylus tenuis TaxID=148309 RepID=A0AAD5LZ40_PARTN|nr:hypothetical protein KIN20_001931 [Parelaphostrongylus tenuis]
MLIRRTVRYAHAAAAASAAHRSATKEQTEQITKLPSGLTVASVDHKGPISQLVLLFRAGSRYEGPNQHGLVHYLRNSVGRDSANYPGLSLIWSSAVSGGRVNAFSTRDVYGVSIALPRDETSVGISILGHIAQPAFKPWDVEDVIPTLKVDNAYKQAYDVAFEDIHRAAYRNGSLARSVYAPKVVIDKLNYKELAEFSARYLTTEQAVLYGTNIEHERMVLYGESHAPINNGQKIDPTPSPYKGGEWRRPAGGSLAHVLLAGEGAALSDAKAMATQAVLLTSLGKSANVQFSGSPGSASVLRALSGNGAASAFQAAYQDTGLAGVYIVADSAHVSKAVSSAASAIKNYRCNDLEAAKRRASNEFLRYADHNNSASIDRATQILAGLIAQGAIVESIKQVSASDVEAAAKKLSSKFSLSCYGNIDEVPYVDTL